MDERQRTVTISLCLMAYLVSGPVSKVAHAQVAQTADIQYVPAVSIAIHVSSTEKASRRATYTPPPGWYILSDTVTLTRRWGTTSYSVSTVPAGWAWASQDRLDESYSKLIQLAAKAHDLGLQAKLELDRDALIRDWGNTTSSHHALVVEVSASGDGLFRSAACIELSVTVDLVYLGIEELPLELDSPDLFP